MTNVKLFTLTNGTMEATHELNNNKCNGWRYQGIGMKQGSNREILLNILYKNSFRCDPNSNFELASGKKSNIYIDAKLTTLCSEAMLPLGSIFFEKIKDLNVNGIGGLTLGADQIAYAAALISNGKDKPLDVFVVRKEAKKHGMMRWVEGPLEKGAKVVIVDDVVTTGASTIMAIRRAMEAGFEVKKVIVLVDREEGGMEEIKREVDCEVEAIFTKRELLEIHKKNPSVINLYQTIIRHRF